MDKDKLKKLIEKNKYYIWLSYIEGINIKKLEILLEKYEKLEKLFIIEKEKLIRDFENEERISEKLLEKLADRKLKINLEEILNKYLKYNIYPISYKDKNYPKLLKEIYDYPILIYALGNIELLKSKYKKLAMIGCRDYSEYGKKICLEFSEKISKNKIVVVSGLARGIDSFSHIGAIKGGGYTIGIVGNGLDIVYPKENRKLEEEIIKKGGLLISEYPLGKNPNKYTFPARNRIISGISNGVFVIEAKEKSGTLITVDFAIEQGRDVFVIPGNINNINSKGTNNLIKEGANIVTKIEDIKI